MECCGNTIKDLYGFSCPLKCSTYILQSVVSKYINQKNRYFKSHAAGTSQINLSRSDVLNCTIYIPKVDEQHCVSNFIINVEKIINFYEYKKRHIIQIKNILLNTMFI